MKSKRFKNSVTIVMKTLSKRLKVDLRIWRMNFIPYKVNKKNNVLAYERMSHDVDEKRREFEHLELEYLKNQAGILATTLQDQRPCPVCGSLEHPHPAQLNTKANEDQYLKAKSFESTTTI